MEQKRKSEPLSADILAVKNLLLQLKEYDPSLGDSIDLNLKRLDNFKKYAKGVTNLVIILFLVAVFALGLFLYSTYYNVKVEDINTEINDLRADSLIKRLLDVKEELGPDSTVTYKYSYVEKGKEPVTYQDLVMENDSLIEVVAKARNDHDAIQRKLNVVSEQFDITFKTRIVREKGSTTYYTSYYSKKLDSAIVLLNTFRHKLQYDKAKDEWIINE